MPPGADAALPSDRPAGLAEVLRTALDPDPARRFATAGEMAVALELCRHPQLTPPAHGWRAWIRRHPVLTLLPLGALPNALASLFNIFYNWQAIIEPWGKPGRERAAPEAFPPLINAINGVFFPLCLALFAWGIWPLARAAAAAGRRPFTPRGRGPGPQAVPGRRADRGLRLPGRVGGGRRAVADASTWRPCGWARRCSRRRTTSTCCSP